MSTLKRKCVSNPMWKYEPRIQMESLRRNYNCIILYSYLFECFDTHFVFEFIWIKAYLPWGSICMLLYVQGTNFVYHVTAPSPTRYYNINFNVFLTSYSWNSIYSVWLENLHIAQKSLYWNYIRSWCPLLSGNLCPILCGSTNIAFKWSH